MTILLIDISHHNFFFFIKEPMKLKGFLPGAEQLLASSKQEIHLIGCYRNSYISLHFLIAQVIIS